MLLTVSGLYSCITFSDAIELGNLCSDGEWFIEGYPDWDDPNVTAWMPLPEPYGYSGIREQQSRGLGRQVLFGEPVSISA